MRTLAISALSVISVPVCLSRCAQYIPSSMPASSEACHVSPLPCPCPALPCPALPCPALPCPASPCHFTALPCPVLPYPALTCLAVPFHCPALPCHCLALSCLTLPFPASSCPVLSVLPCHNLPALRCCDWLWQTPLQTEFQLVMQEVINHTYSVPHAGLWPASSDSLTCSTAAASLTLAF